MEIRFVKEYVDDRSARYVLESGTASYEYAAVLGKWTIDESGTRSVEELDVQIYIEFFSDSLDIDAGPAWPFPEATKHCPCGDEPTSGRKHGQEAHLAPGRAVEPMSPWQPVRPA